LISWITLQSDKWYKICEANLPEEKQRIHSSIEGRYITLFRQKGVVTAIDAICYHAVGPLTLGPLKDIEELGGITTVSCPWHKFLVSITDGTRIYQEVKIGANGKPSVKGWTVGKVVQRTHKVFEDESGVYVVRNSIIVFFLLIFLFFVVKLKLLYTILLLKALMTTGEKVDSDKDSKNTPCVKDYKMHPEEACYSPEVFI
jgi:nitrite reductase/ring-hydroxylating ferredoxin subunit